MAKIAMQKSDVANSRQEKCCGEEQGDEHAGDACPQGHAAAAVAYFTAEPGANDHESACVRRDSQLNRAIDDPRAEGMILVRLKECSCARVRTLTN